MEQLSRGKYIWGLQLRSLEIVDSTALEYDGNAIRSYLFPEHTRNACCMDETAEEHFRLHPDRYFLRSSLFGYQRYLCKWGGDMNPEWDRSYSLYYFIFLQCYRVKLPWVMKGVVADNDYSRWAEFREEAAADLRRSLSQLGENDLKDWPDCRMEKALRGTMDSDCERLPSDVRELPETILARACDNEKLLRMTNPQDYSHPDKLEDLDTSAAMDAYKNYIERGIVHEDDNVNRLIFKMLLWYQSQRPECRDVSKRSYILFALMYLHLYRTAFSRFAGIHSRVAKWNGIPFKVRETVAANFRRRIAALRELRAKPEGGEDGSGRHSSLIGEIWLFVHKCGSVLVGQ